MYFFFARPDASFILAMWQTVVFPDHERATFLRGSFVKQAWTTTPEANEIIAIGIDLQDRSLRERLGAALTEPLPDYVSEARQEERAKQQDIMLERAKEAVFQRQMADRLLEQEALHRQRQSERCLPGAVGISVNRYLCVNAIAANSSAERSGLVGLGDRFGGGALPVPPCLVSHRIVRVNGTIATEDNISKLFSGMNKIKRRVVVVEVVLCAGKCWTSVELEIQKPSGVTVYVDLMRERIYH